MWTQIVLRRIVLIYKRIVAPDQSLTANVMLTPWGRTVEMGLHVSSLVTLLQHLATWTQTLIPHQDQQKVQLRFAFPAQLFELGIPTVGVQSDEL